MNERFQLLAALPGTAIKCLLALWWENRQLTVTELEPRVDHDKSTVRKALAQLALYGLAAQVIASQETWRLTDKGYQLPLPLDALASGEKFTSPIDAEVSANLVALQSAASAASAKAAPRRARREAWRRRREAGRATWTRS